MIEDAIRARAVEWATESMRGSVTLDDVATDAARLTLFAMQALGLAAVNARIEVLT